MKRSRLKIVIAIFAVALVAAMSLVMFAACNNTQEIIEKCTVTFMNGDEVFETQHVTLGEKYELPKDIPTQEQPDDDHEMQFVGWTLDSNYYEYRSDIIEEPDFVVADIVIYAAFRKVAIADTPGQGADKEYEVEFRMPVGEDFGDMSGVTLDEFTQKVKRYMDADVPTLDEMPKIKGYHFTGQWTGGTLTNVRGRRRVVAVYEKNVYTLTLHYLDKSDERKLEFRAPVDLSEEPQVDEAFKFEGWYDDAEFQTKATLTEMPDSDVHIYAKFHVDFSTASVSKEGTMVYGDASNKLYVSGLKDCDGLAYTFDWTVNGEKKPTSAQRNFELRQVGTYNVKLHIYANYKNGVLTDQAYAHTADNSQDFTFAIQKATLTAVVTLNASSIVYGSAAPTASVVYSGFVFDETQESAHIAQRFVYMQGDSDVTGTDLHVGSYRVETIPQEHANYRFAPISAQQFDVTPKALDVTATVSDHCYGTPLEFDIGFDGFVFGEGKEALGEHWFTLGGSDQKYVGGERLHAGKYSAQLQGYASSDYDVRLPKAFEFEVSRRAGSAKLTAVGGIYGATPAISIQFDNVFPEDQARFSSVFAYQRGGNPYSLVDRFVVGNYFVTASFIETGFSDYQTLEVTGAEFSISKKPLNVYVSVKSSYVYGETIDRTLTYEDAFEFGESENSIGLISGSVRYIFRTASDGKAYDLTKFNVDDYTVEASGVSAENYDLKFPQAKFSVTKKALALGVHLESDTILYGSTPRESTAANCVGGISYDGFVEGENARGVFGNELPSVYYLDAQGQRVTQFHAGTYTATTSADPRNYSVTVSSVELTVLRRTLCVNVVLPAPSMAYGNKPTATTIAYDGQGYDGFVSMAERELYTSSAYVKYAGKLSYTQAQLASDDVKMVAGEYSVSVEGVDDKINGDYDVTFGYLKDGLKFVVLKATLDVTLSANANSYVYGTRPGVTATYRGFAYNETEQELFGENAHKILYRNSATGEQSEDRLAVGSYVATLSGIENDNYTVDLKEFSLTVEKKTLTVKVSAASFTYGDKAKPEPQVSYSGFVYDENSSVLGGAAKFAYKRGENRNSAKTDYSGEFFDAGYYTVTVGGLESKNYALDYVQNSDNDFTVEKRNFTAKVSAKSIMYGDEADYGFEHNVLDRDEAGFAFKCVVAYRSGNVGKYEPYDEAQHAHYQAGNYQVSLEFKQNPNYNNISVSPVNFTVSKRTLTATIDAKNITYGEEKNYSYNVDNILDDADRQSFGFNLVVKRKVGRDYVNYVEGDHDYYQAGDYQLSLEFTQDPNYNDLVVSPVEFNVAKRTFTAKISANGDLVYGDDNVQYSYTTQDVMEKDVAKFGFRLVLNYRKDGGAYKVYDSDLAHYQAGDYQVALEYTPNSNYNDHVVSPVEFKIAKRTLTATISADNITYGEKENYSYKVDNILAEDEAGFGFHWEITYCKDDSGQFATYYPDSYAHYQAGKYKVSLKYTLDPNYNDITGATSAEFTVAKRAFTATISANGDLTYGDDKVQYSYSTTDIMEDDREGFDFRLTLSYHGEGSAEFAPYQSSKYAHYQAGDYLIALEYEHNSNYAEIAKPTAAFKVLKKQLTVTVTAAGFTYGGSAHPAISEDGLVSGDEKLLSDPKFSYSGNYDGGIFHAGEYTVTVDNIVSSNYDIHIKEGSFVVSPAPITVTVKAEGYTYGDRNAPSVDLTYGEFKHRDTAQTLGAPSYTYKRSATEGGEKTAYAAEKIFKAGYYTIGVDGLSSSDYAIEIVSKDIVITKATLTVTVSVEGFKYDGVTAPTPTVRRSGFKNNENESSLGGEINYVYSGAFRDGVYHAGEYTAKAEGYTSDNYDIIYATSNFTVSPREVSISFYPAWNTYANDPTAYNWYSLSGDDFVKGDDLNFAVSYTKNGEAYEANERYFSVGKYVVTVGYTENADYIVKHNDEETHGSIAREEFTIAPLPLTLTIQGNTPWSNRESWSQTPSLSDARFTLDGVIVLKSKEVSANTYTDSDGALGDYFAWQDKYSVKLKENSADVTGNVQLIYSINLALSDSSFSVKIPNDTTFTYDGEAHTFTVTAEADDIAAKDITYTYCLAEDGNYTTDPIKITDWKDGGYTICYKVNAPNAKEASGQFTVIVKKATLSVSPIAPVRAAYDGTNKFKAIANENVNGLVKNDEMTVKYGRSADACDESTLTLIDVADSCTVHFSVSAGDNYSEATGSYIVTISRANITFTKPQDVDAVFTPDTEHFEAVTKISGATGDKSFDATVLYGRSADACDKSTLTLINVADSCTVYFSISAGDNYNEATGNYLVTIKPATITFTAPQNIEKTYAPGENRFAPVTGIAGVEGDSSFKATVLYGKNTSVCTQSTLTLINVADSCTVYFSISAGGNYNVATGNYSVKINKADYSVEVASEQSYPYDASAHGTGVTFTGVGTEINPAGASVQYSYTGQEEGAGKSIVPQFTNYKDGGYEVSYTITGNSNYNEANGSYKVAITKANITFTAPQDVEDTYAPKKDRFAEVADIAGVEGDSSFKATVLYGKNTSVCTQSTLTLINVADSCTVYFSVSAGDNYNEATGNYKVAINKASVRVPKIEDSVPYKKDATQKPEVPDGEGLYAVTQNDGGKYVGDYDVVLTLSDAANYKWSDGTEGAVKELTFHITKATVTRPTENKGTFTYNAAQQTYTPDGFDEDTMTIAGNEQTSADAYTVTVSLKDAKNYKWATEAESDKISFSFVIGKANYAVTAVDTSFDYNGKYQGDAIVVKGVGTETDPSCKITYNGSEEVAKFKDHQDGGHKVSYTITGNSNYNDAEGSYTVTINKATPALKQETDGAPYTYGGDRPGVTEEIILAAVQANASGNVYDSDAITITMFKDGVKIEAGTIEELLAKISGAGTYVIKVNVKGANYNDAEGSYTVTISPKELTVEITPPASATYNGGSHGGDALVTLNGLIAGDSSANVATITYSYTDPGTKASATSATAPTFIDAIGDLAVTVTVKIINGNYKLVGDKVDESGDFTDTYTLTINKATLTVSRDDISATYDGTDHFGGIKKENISGLIGSDGFTVTYSTEQAGNYVAELAIINATNAGAVTVWYKIDAGDNYNVYEGSYTVKIAKANITFTAPQNVDETYAPGENRFAPVTGIKGVEKDSPFHATVLYGKNTSVCTQSTLSLINVADSCTVYFSVSAGDNYNEATGSYKVNINKATLTVNPDNIDETYDGTDHFGGIKKENISGLIGSDGFTVTYSKDIGGSYGDAWEMIDATNSAVTVYFKITAGDNYNEAEGSYTVTISPKALTVTLPADISETYNGATYGGNDVTIDGVVAGDVLANIVSITYAYETTQNGYTTYSKSTAPTFINAIENLLVKVTVALKSDNPNYTIGGKGTFEDSYKVNIAKVTLTVSRDDISATYDGTDHFGGIKKENISGLIGSDGFTVTYSTEQAGNYVAELAIINATNAGAVTVWYKIDAGANYNEKTGSYTVTIAKAALNRPTPNTGTFTYNKELQTYNPVGFDPNTMTITDNEQTNAGEYPVTVSLKDTDNYKWATGGENDASTFTFTIAKAKLDKLPDGVTAPFVTGEVVVKLGLTLNTLCQLGDNWAWAAGVDAAKDITAGENRYLAQYTDPSNNYLPYDVTVTFTARKQRITVSIADLIELNFNDALNLEKITGITVKGEGNSDLTSEELKLISIIIGNKNIDTSIGSTYLAKVTLDLTNNAYFELEDGTPTENSIIIKIKSVEYNGNLYTIEDALAIATGGNIIVKHNTAFATKEIAELAGYNGDTYYTVKSGVTLKLPYDGSNTYGSPGAEATGTDTLSFGDSSKQMLILYIPANIVLSNAGKIEVGGYVTGSGAGHMSGQTYDKYARIDLGANARIESTGDIDVYGFITEETWNNGSQVIMHSGTMKMPFVVVEHRGGSVFSNFKKDLKGSPFNRFFMHNVSALLIFESGANLYGSAKLKTDKKEALGGLVSVPAQENATEIHLIGTDSKALIQLKDGSKVISKLQAESFTTAHAKVPTQLNIYGDIVFNALSLNVSVPIVGDVKVTTSGVLFPLSWYWQVTLNTLNGQPATVDATAQDLKLLPGAKLIIEKGVTLNVGKIAVYKQDSWTDAGVGGTSKYEVNKGDATLIVNGTLNVNEIGGKISSSTEGAIVNVSQKVAIISLEVKSSTGNALEKGALTWDNIELALNFNAGSVDGIGTYVYKNNTWQKSTKTITFTVKFHNGDEVSNETYTVHVIDDTYSLIYLDKETPSKQYYNFIGWYFDEQLSKRLGDTTFTVTDGQTIDVYAGWEKIEYEIIYYVDCAGEDSNYNNPNASTWKTGDAIKLENAEHNINKSLTFKGWFADTDYTILIKEISDSNIVQLMHYGVVVLYGCFEDLNKDYEVTFVVNAPDGYDGLPNPNATTIQINQKLGEKLSSVDLTMYDNDVTKQSYFDGWAANGKPVTADTTIDTSYFTDGKLILTAQWKTKCSVTVNKLSNATVTINGQTLGLNNSLWFKPETTITVTATYDKSDKKTLTISPNDGVDGNNDKKTFTIKEDRTISASSSNSCIAEGTLIMLADGTQKPIEEVTMEDEVIVFNHYTGQYETSRMLYIDHSGLELSLYRVINLEFDNGTLLRIVSEHALFDLTLNKYVFINEDTLMDYIGHEFTTTEYDGDNFISGKTVLVNVYVTEEYTKIYGPVTETHLDMVTEGLLTMPAFPYGYQGFINYFEYGEDMKFNEEAMQADIEQYGLYTYEDFKDILPYDLWCKAPWQYFKIAVGKGMLTWEQIIEVIQYLYTIG